jgi:hypothetical protein
MAGFVTAASAAGDPRHLKCALYGGLTLAAVSLVMILRSVFLGRTAPAVAVVDILEAPSVALRAKENEARIGELSMRQDIADDNARVLARLLHLMDASRGHTGPDCDATAPQPCLSLVRDGEHTGGHAG